MIKLQIRTDLDYLGEILELGNILKGQVRIYPALLVKDSLYQIDIKKKKNFTHVANVCASLAT